MSGRTALMTGGGGAMAREIALRLEKKGYRLVLVDVDEERMAANAELLSSPVTRVADLSSPEEIRAVAEWIEAEHPDLDLLVNNAGLIQPGDVDEVSAADIDRHVNVNLLAPMHLTRAAARVMKPRRRGDILTIVSMGGILALPGSASYAASKFGLRGFQTSIRTKLAPHGIRVMGVFPSGVDTPMLRYEATHGGSALNFVGKVKTVADVGDAVEKALRSGSLETYVPYGDSLTTRLVGTVPWAIEKVVPMFTKSGEKGRAAFIAERGL
jgi:NAD(P)-dependent dehydrogenase (short-subunit alcohol dehydrogenase family)